MEQRVEAAPVVLVVVVMVEQVEQALLVLSQE
jgi:hypothetical protein